MTKNSTYVEDVLVAIESVRARLKDAYSKGNFGQADILMGDLVALEVCLFIETDKLVKSLHKVAA